MESVSRKGFNPCLAGASPRVLATFPLQDNDELKYTIQNYHHRVSQNIVHPYTLCWPIMPVNAAMPEVILRYTNTSDFQFH